ncbi:unnamed protein product [Protopolystoma xenopodis]|uniref:Uncharacterized protein n=1 Tax=Protopolystoma xenopodis TaxID=117903 RepID=A0A448X1A4_9PLAT|nr:unnamed protein product [Protopolystoma xenopodis]
MSSPGSSLPTPMQNGLVSRKDRPESASHAKCTGRLGTKSNGPPCSTAHLHSSRIVRPAEYPHARFCRSE